MFVYVAWSPVQHVAPRFSVKKMSQKKSSNNNKNKEKDKKIRNQNGLISQVQVLTLFNFTSPTTWCTNEIRRLELAQKNNFNQNLFVFPLTSQE